MAVEELYRRRAGWPWRKRLKFKTYTIAADLLGRIRQLLVRLAGSRTRDGRPTGLYGWTCWLYWSRWDYHVYPWGHKWKRDKSV